MAKIQRAYYAIIPADVRYSDISPNAKLLYGEITALCNQEGFCWATNAYFAELYQVANKTISRWVGELKTKGFIYYTISEKTNRKIYMTHPKNVLGVGQKCPGGVGQKADHNTIVYNNTINNSAARAADTQKVDPNTLMDLGGFVDWCKKGNQRHIKIIADFAEEKKLKFTTRGQWEMLIKRNLRAAQSLAPYTDDQIGKAITAILKAEKGYLEKWTLETVYKYLIQ